MTENKNDNKDLELVVSQKKHATYSIDRYVHAKFKAKCIERNLEMSSVLEGFIKLWINHVPKKDKDE